MGRHLFFLAISLTIFFISCSKTSDIGGDIVIDDYNTEIISASALKARTITTAPPRGFIRDQNPYNHLFLGSMADPIFGKTTAQLNAQFVLSIDTYSSEFRNPQVDSVVLSMQYDSLSLRGDILNERMNVYVYRLSEQLSVQANYSTNAEFNFNPTPVGQLLDHSAFKTDSIMIQEPVKGKYIEKGLPASLRIPLDKSFGEELLSYDSISYVNNSRFIEKFKGLHIEAEVEDAMIAFNLLSGNSSSSLDVYYKEDTIPKVFKLKVENGLAVATNTFQHDYVDSEIEEFLGDYELGDSLLFVQGLSGVEVEVELEDLKQYEDKVINLAEITMYYADIEGNEPYVPDIDLLTMTQDYNERNVLISDAENAERTGNPDAVETLFGGKAIKSDSVKYVKFRLPLFFQEAVKEQHKPVLKIRPRTKATNVDRAIFYGPKHSRYPMTLRIIYTELN